MFTKMIFEMCLFNLYKNEFIKCKYIYKKHQQV